MVSAVNNGVFVCFILKNSPAALGGLRFGDQILRINDTVLAGYSTEKVHNLIRKLPVNNINFMIRDRYTYIITHHNSYTYLIYFKISRVIDYFFPNKNFNREK